LPEERNGYAVVLISNSWKRETEIYIFNALRVGYAKGISKCT
jgi:hypothetical protein